MRYDKRERGEVRKGEGYKVKDIRFEEGGFTGSNRDIYIYI